MVEVCPWREFDVTDKHSVAVWRDADFEAIAMRALQEVEDNGVIEFDKQCKVFGKEYQRPRGTVFFADEDMSGYKYGGGKDEPQCIVEGSAIGELLAHANRYAGADKFHGVLLNYYRDGKDSVSLHEDKDVCDDEFLGVLSISLGCCRVMGFKSKTGYTTITKEDGMVMGMCGEGFQKHIKHEIKAVRKAPVGWSASFTFRRHVSRKRKRA